MAKTLFLTFEQAITIHDDQIERYGGKHGIARIELLESAIMRPQTTFGGQQLYPSLFDKAAALMHSLIMNHAFIDGNKRTASVSAITFLELNGYRLEVGQKDLIDATLEVRRKKLDIKKLSAWLKKHSRKV